MGVDNKAFFQNESRSLNEQFVGSNGGVSAAASAGSKAAKLSGTADLIAAGGQVAGLAITTIAGIQDGKQRALYERNLDSLTSDQQKALKYIQNLTELCNIYYSLE